MNPLTNYAEVFNKNDSKLFAELFADDCIFYDTAPTCAGMDPISGQCYTAEMGPYVCQRKRGRGHDFQYVFPLNAHECQAGLAQRQCSGLHHLLPRY